MKGHGAKYPRKKDQAILALLTHPTIGEAADTAGVSEVTLWRWLQDQDFQQSYREAKRQVVQQALTRVQQVSGEAVDVLRDVMADDTKPPSSRVTAARTILDMALKSVEIEDLEARIEALERRINP
jgi:DNA-binding MurR/RpiR family transcriptional regulator